MDAETPRAVPQALSFVRPPVRGTVLNVRLPRTRERCTFFHASVRGEDGEEMRHDETVTAIILQ